MVTLLATAAAATVALTLLASTAAHLARPRRLPAALARQAVLPVRLATAVAVAVVAAEAALGLAVALGARTAGLAGAAVLLAGYAGYTGYLSRTRAGVPCGCGDDVAVSGWVAGRAAALAATALLGLVLSPVAVPAVEVAVALCAGAAFACLLWALPAAMAVPAGAAA